MLVVNRFVVEGDDTAFRARAATALAALGARPGYLRGQLGRAYDDPTRWTLVTEWVSVGAYRRALSAYEEALAREPTRQDLRRAAADLALGLGRFDRAADHLERLAHYRPDEPSALEILAEAAPGRPVVLAESDLVAAPPGRPS